MTFVSASGQLSSGVFSLCLAGQPASDSGSIWAAWSLAPQTVLPLVVVCGLYLRGRSKLISDRDGRRPTALNAGFFGLGMLMLGVALVSPLCRMASSLAWAHMLQHAIIVAVAPPLLLLGRPGAVFGAALPVWYKATLDRLRITDHPLSAGAIYGAAIWLWHMPYFYQAALFNAGVHLLMYATLLAVSLAFWQGVAEALRAPGTRSGFVAASLVGTIIHTGLLGALLTFSQSPWYPLAGESTDSSGISPLEDQALAGLIMWVPMGAIYFVAGLAVVSAWLNALSATRPNVTPQSDFASPEG